MEKERVLNLPDGKEFVHEAFGMTEKRCSLLGGELADKLVETNNITPALNYIWNRSGVSF